MQGQSVAAEALRVGCLADFLYAQDIAFGQRSLQRIPANTSPRN
jgi:hypothetical protein